MTKETLARGGAKPKMLPGSKDLGLTIGESRKYGLYELSAKGDCLARRVELPAWLSEAAKQAAPTLFLSRLKSGQIAAPAEEVKESKGHIYLTPPAELGFEGPALGVDMEIFEELLREGSSVKSLRFGVYATGYEPLVVWTLNLSEFLEKARKVESKPPFMPQMMIPLSALRHLPR